MISLLAINFLILGLIIGSFLNVVILRFNTKSLGGRSGCMSCMSKLTWYELIPVFSFIGLGGRCRNCKTKISIQYPLVELFTGLIFAGIFLKFQTLFFSNTAYFAITFLYYAILFSILIIIAVYDLKHKIIPDMLSFIFGLLAFIGLFFFIYPAVAGQAVFVLHIPTLLDFLSGIFIAFPFAFFWLISGGRWMGLGDAKLALGLGWMLHAYMAITSLIFSFWSGAIVGLLLIFISKYGKIKKLGIKSEIPFAPFLVFATIIVFLFNLNFFNFIQ